MVYYSLSVVTSGCMLQLQGNLHTATDLSLPTPACEYHQNDTHIFVYKLKDSQEKDFKNNHLSSLLCEARKSYLRYGDVPLIDRYDAKSTVYLARAMYPLVHKSISCYVEEWTSLRFIPAAGAPFSTEDLEAFIYKGKSLSERMKTILFQDHPQAFEQIVTVSRICRIPPRVSEDRFYSSHDFLPKKNKYTSLCFLLMNHTFFEECERQGKEYTWLTALAKEELFQKILYWEKGNTKFVFPFTQARQVLQIPPEDSIQVNRSLLSYQFPGYFLNVQELFSFFEKLLEQERITETTLQHYFSISLPVKEALRCFSKLSEEEYLRVLRGMSVLLQSDGWVPGSLLHASELRSLCDIFVSDAIHLYLSSIPVWKKQIYEWKTTVL